MLNFSLKFFDVHAEILAPSIHDFPCVIKFLSKDFERDVQMLKSLTEFVELKFDEGTNKDCSLPIVQTISMFS